MKVQGETSLNGSLETVWDSLLDPEVMSRCIPGCRELRAAGNDTYTTTLRVGVGPVSGTYEGEFRIKDKAPRSRFVMLFEGTGPQGFVKGSGEAVLHGGSPTLLSYDCNVEVGGLVASVGQRMLQGVSKFLINQMFSKLQQHVGQEGDR